MCSRLRCTHIIGSCYGKFILYVYFQTRYCDSFQSGSFTSWRNRWTSLNSSIYDSILINNICWRWCPCQSYLCTLNIRTAKISRCRRSECYGIIIKYCLHWDVGEIWTLEKYTTQSCLCIIFLIHQASQRQVNNLGLPNFMCNTYYHIPKSL